MKQAAFAAFVAFWSSLATLLVVNALAPASVSAEARATPISASQLAAHDTEEDCWMAIEGKVYDLTQYLPNHPTPASILIPWCGKEATKGMRTKGYGRDHSPTAWGMLPEYQVGVLVEEE